MVFKTSEEIEPVYNRYVDRFLGNYGVNSVSIRTLQGLREEAGMRGLEFHLSDEEHPEYFGLEIGTLTEEIDRELPRHEYQEARLLYITIGQITLL